MENRIDHRLRFVAPKMQWGFQPLPESIWTIEDNGKKRIKMIFFLDSLSFFYFIKEFLMAIGTRIVIFEDEAGHNASKIMFPPYPDVIFIISRSIIY